MGLGVRVQVLRVQFLGVGELGIKVWGAGLVQRRAWTIWNLPMKAGSPIHPTIIDPVWGVSGNMGWALAVRVEGLGLRF